MGYVWVVSSTIEHCACVCDTLCLCVVCDTLCLCVLLFQYCMLSVQASEGAEEATPTEEQAMDQDS